jgi:hypothetical protein
MVFHREGARISTDKAFIRLVTALAAQAGEVVVFGRLDPAPGRAPYRVAGGNIRFVALPHYPRVTHVRAVAASLPRAARTFGDELASLDAAVVVGPHPVALAFALMTKRARPARARRASRLSGVHPPPAARLGLGGARSARAGLGVPSHRADDAGRRGRTRAGAALCSRRRRGARAGRVTRTRA